MDYQACLNLLTNARTDLEQGHLFAALQGLKAVAAYTKSASCSDELELLYRSYSMMLAYMARGAEDHERRRMFLDFVRRSYEVSDRLQRQTELLNTASSYTIAFRTLEHLRGGRSSLDELLSHDTDYRTLFDAVWVSDNWNSSEKEAVAAYMCDDRIDEFHKCVLISAVTMACARIFDISKYDVLLNYVLVDATMLRVRALVGLVFVHFMQAHRLQLYPHIFAKLRGIVDTHHFAQELEMVQLQLFLTQETQHVERNVQQTIIPEMMKQVNNLKIDRSLQLDNILDAISNPEWEGENPSAKLEEHMRELSDLQQRGADVYIGTFRMLKQRFPFFSIAANWFCPFTWNHPGLDDKCQKGGLLDWLVKKNDLCDSDKYSLCLMMSALPDGQSLPGLEQLRGNVDDGIVVELAPGESVYPDEFRSLLRSYMQDFYRFCTLYRNRKDFANPFLQNLLIADYFPFESLLRDEDLTRRLADFVFANKSYKQARSLYERLEPAVRTAEICQKLAYCCQMTQDYESAIAAYIQADKLREHSTWTLRQLANCYRAVGLYEEALAVYLSLMTVLSDDLSLEMQIAECYIHLQRYEEAFKHLFKVDYLDTKSMRAARALAWCSLLTNKYEQAERYYQKVLSSVPSTADWLNAGHAAWLLGNLQEAVTRYRRCIHDMKDEDKVVFLKEDTEMLLALGLTLEDMAMMTDLVLYSVENE